MMDENANFVDILSVYKYVKAQIKCQISHHERELKILKQKSLAIDSIIRKKCLHEWVVEKPLHYTPTEFICKKCGLYK